MTYILPYAIQEGNLIYLLKSDSDVQSVKPSMPQHVRSHFEVHRINQLTFMKKGAVALTCGSSFYISNTKRRASKSPAFVV